VGNLYGMNQPVEPRPLDANETAILLRVVHQLEEPVARALETQVRQAMVSGGFTTMVDLAVQPGVPPVDVPDGPLAVRTLHEGGEVLVWITGGRVSALEYAWWTDDEPAGMPDAESLTIAPYLPLGICDEQVVVDRHAPPDSAGVVVSMVVEPLLLVSSSRFAKPV
jgi:hypothetical protein